MKRPQTLRRTFPKLLFFFCVCAYVLPTGGQTIRQQSDEQAAQVAERYWNRRFIRCGVDVFVWAERQPNAAGPRTYPAHDALFFFGEGRPVISVDRQEQRRGGSQIDEWSRRSVIIINKSRAFCEDCDRNDWKNNLRYNVGIRKVNGVWQTFEENNVIAEPLFEDIVSGEGFVLITCLQLGGNPNAVNAAGDSLLITAVKAGRERAVEALLAVDADVNVKDRNGSTPSYIARLGNHEDIAAQLDQSGAICQGPEARICDKFPRNTTDLIAPDPMLIRPRDQQQKRDPPGLQKVRIVSKPEAEYTDEARLNKISGTVILRVLFLPSGEVTIKRVVAGLPYGLTEKAIEAAKKLKFIPAMLDGRAVGKEMQVEYNFNP